MDVSKSSLCFCVVGKSYYFQCIGALSGFVYYFKICFANIYAFPMLYACVVVPHRPRGQQPLIIAALCHDLKAVTHSRGCPAGVCSVVVCMRVSSRLLWLSPFVCYLRCAMIHSYKDANTYKGGNIITKRLLLMQQLVIQKSRARGGSRSPRSV